MTDFPEQKPSEPQSAKPYKYVPRVSDDEVYGPSRRWMLIGGVGAVIAVLLIGVLLFKFHARSKTVAGVSVVEPGLLPAVQWTNDPGVNITPAFSHDGKLVAYASDREGAGNLAIWLRPYPSGEPRRLTIDGFHAIEPDFSPDDKQIVYHSEKDGGGIYIIPVAGGEPKLLVKEGLRPRFSPSGKWIAYYVTADDPHATHSGASRVFVIAPEGGAPRQIRPEFALARYPIWLPGDDLLLIEAMSTQDVLDWWVTPVTGGNAIRTFAFEKLKDLAVHAAPMGWDHGKVLFSGANEADVHIWELPLEPPVWQASGTPRQLSATSGADRTGAVGPDGRVAFASMQATMDIWSLPLDNNRPKTGGALQRVTDDHAQNLVPQVGLNATKMIYLSNKTGTRDLWANDLKAGTSWAVSPFHHVIYRPVLSPDETRVAYRTNIDGQCLVTVQDLDRRSSRNLNLGCFNLWDWSPDGASFMISDPAAATIEVALWKIDSRQRQPLLSHSAFDLFDASFSPEGKWIAFSSGPTIGGAEVYVAPFHGAPIKEAEWIPITHAGGSLTAWSPGGDILFYHSRRDSFHCIWAQRLDSARRPTGEPYAVQHLHTASLGMFMIKPNDFHMSVTKDRLLFNLPKETANLWITGKQ